MSEKTQLKIMKCPTCGASLKAENNTDMITCVYCGNSVVPVIDAPVAPQNDAAAAIGGVVRVDGIKTSSSALAYIDLLFEEYDWESFTYAQAISVTEIDKLAKSLKVSSADDKNTWFVCFKAIFVPFVHKIEGCKQILASVIDEYKKNSLDAYSRFDAYKRIAAMVSARKDSTLENLEKIVANAAKYGASSAEVKKLNADIDSIKKLEDIELFADIESIPEIQTFISEKNAQIAETLAEDGINAEAAYARAKTLIEEKKYVEAMNILSALKGYSDSVELIKKIDKYFLISDVLEIEGKLYYFMKEESEESDTLNLHPTVNGKIAGKPIIRDIGQIITNYADILYYLDGENQLKKYNLATHVEEKVCEKIGDKKAIRSRGRKVFVHSRKVYFLSDKGKLAQLELRNGTIRILLENINSIVSLTGNKMIYTVSEKVKGANDEENESRILTNIINIDTMDVVKLGTKNVSIEGFIGDYIVYTQASPNKFNKNLYVKALNSNEGEKLIEKNIYRFCAIISGKLFYYIGNARNQALININFDGTERREWPLYISDVLFAQGGWLYFIRRAGYNAVLCKSRLDGSQFSVIAADIDKFITLKNGYLYYINDVSTLVKVRMDGSNLQNLCDDVESVLAVKENKIIFISIDGRIVDEDSEERTTKIVKSIYAVDFSGSGTIKLAYDIKNAKEYDENTVYYIAEKEIKSSYDELDKRLKLLYKLDVETYSVDGLLALEIQEEKRRSPGFVIAMIIMAIAFLIAVISLVGKANISFVMINLIAGIVSLIVGINIKKKRRK